MGSGERSLLSAVKPGAACVIEAVEAEAPAGLVHRLMALGFVPGTRVVVVRRAPLGDPVEYELRGSRICLRASEASLFRVRPGEVDGAEVGS